MMTPIWRRVALNSRDARASPIRFGLYSPLAIHVSLVADPDHPDYQHVVLELADNPVVSYPVSPQPGACSGERLAAEPRVGKLADLLQVGHDAPLPRTVDVTKRLHGQCIEFNSPNQGCA